MKCGWCGQFIGYDDKDAMTYTNYGSYPDLEPPDATDVCGRCWIKCNKKEYYKNPEYIWRPITKLFGV